MLLLQPKHQGGAGRISWAGRLQGSEIWFEKLHQCLVAFCLSRVEEIKWTDWAKDVGVLKEEPGTSDSDINPEGKLNHEERSAVFFKLPAQRSALGMLCLWQQNFRQAPQQHHL